jgi:PAS domain S-box-containing protein
MIGIIQDITNRKNSEEKLRESEALYRMLASNLPNGAAFILDHDLRYVLAAGKAIEKEGLTSEHFEGHTIREALNESQSRQYEPHFRSALNGKPSSLEHFSQDHYYKSEVTPVFNADKEVTHILALSYDITELKQLESQLKQERELLQTIYDSIPVMLTIYDPRVQEISWNKAFSALTGYTEADHRKHNIMNLVYPDPEYQKEVAHFMNSLIPEFKDFKMVVKDGSVLESSWANVRISDGRNVGIGLDIRQRKLYEKQLSELTSRLQTVVDNITDGVLVYMPDGTLTDLNFAAKKILNLLNDDLVEDDLEDYLYLDQEGNQVPHENTPRNRCLRGEVFNQTEYQLLNPVNNRKLFLEYSGIPVYENGELVLAVITIHNITGRKNAHLQILEANENLKNKNYQLSRVNLLHENLLYIIAHDLRGPITNMQLILNMFDLIPDKDKKIEMMDSLQEMVLRQENIINGLGEIIQVQSPEDIQASRINLEVLLKDIIRENEKELQEIKGKIEFDLTLAPVVVFIKTFIYSILSNLVSNAIKYNNKERELRIEISSSYQDQYFLIKVKDNGVGIDLEKNHKHLYRPFRRFTQQAKGTGIGLYIVKNLVEKNGGKIEVESLPGKGTTFTCFLKEYS